MKKVKSLKGFVIAETSRAERDSGRNNYEIFTKEEWDMGSGYRYPEHDAGSVTEAEEFIKNY